METDRGLVVERALVDAGPDRLVDVLSYVLREHYDAKRVEVRLADYAMRSLRPLEPASPDALPVRVEGSPQGRAFGAQEPLATDLAPDEKELHLPVTMRGDRMGVLSVTLPVAASTAETEAELWHVAAVLAREITLAGR